MVRYVLVDICQSNLMIHEIKFLQIPVHCKVVHIKIT